jgi:regulator of sigma E protease
MNFLYAIPAFIVALGVLIVVHEYGHYLVARLCGVKVLRFSVGFGKPLFVKRIGSDQTEWVIAAVPFGGYVKMLDEREGPVAPHEAERAFNRKSVWRRTAIVVAGPLFNFILAVLIYAGLFMYGQPEARPVLGAPPPGTVAAAAGIAGGDTVTSVNGESVTTWTDVRWQILQAALQRQVVRLETVDERSHLSTSTIDFRNFSTSEVEGDVMGRLGLRLYRPTLPPVIERVIAGGPAEQGGLRAGDRVVSADGKAVATWEDFVTAVRSKPGTPIVLVVESEGATRTLQVTADPKTRIIGAVARQSEAYLSKMFVRVQYGPLDSLWRGAAKTADISAFSLKMLGLMLVGQVSWRNLSGPVTIADVAGQAAQMGLTYYIGVIALLSVSLGVLNLLPIPLLDGGHLMYYVVEVVKGKPVSERAMELGQRVGLALLLVMMAFAFYNDLNRLLTG